MIFSAGLGTRLYPLTSDKPKALAPFCKGTLLSYNLNFLKNQGIKHFIINTHHFADKIESYLNDNFFFKSDVIISYEEILLETAGGLAKVSKHLLDFDMVLIYNVDIISEIDVQSILSNHIENDNDITLAVRKRQSSRYLLFNQNGLLRGWENVKSGEKIGYGTNKFGYSGIGILNTEMLSLIGPPVKKSLIPFFLENCNDKKIGMFDHSEQYWFDCGSLEKLQEAENYLIKITDHETRV